MLPPSVAKTNASRPSTCTDRAKTPHSTDDRDLEAHVAKRANAKKRVPPPKLKAERVQSLLKKSPGWKGKDRRRAVTRTYKLPSFRAALAFVQFVGELAEAADHHPDIDVRYSRVTLTLSTHESGGLTERDFELIAQIDGL